MTTLLAALALVAFGYLFLKAIPLWVYRYVDRARTHDPTILPKSYEVPRYFSLNSAGEVDPSKRWPGWDGWYFFVIPDDRQLPLKMVRASLMTGLYGLEGIDTYEKLPKGLSAFDVVEYLMLVPTEDHNGGRKTRANRFSQFYLPKAATLRMKPDELDVVVSGQPEPNLKARLHAKIQGTWPHYQFQFNNPEAGVRLDLTYQGENVLWWADLPFFTYFAALGKFTGTVTYAHGPDPDAVYTLEGSGGFEHGFARKPCNFDLFWHPVSWAQKLSPTLRPVRYHYELFLGDGPHQGGFMHVRAFGLNWRNHGGLFVNGSYRELRDVEVEYLSDPEPDLMPMKPGVPSVKFYRSWKIKADTVAGRLEYVAQRQWPPARIASNMMYYYFSYTGTYQGKPLSGRGYGEYLHI